MRLDSFVCVSLAVGLVEVRQLHLKVQVDIASYVSLEPLKLLLL